MAELTQQQGQALVVLARQAIRQRLGLEQHEQTKTAELQGSALREQHGVFVTLHKQGKLRGCIGSLIGTRALVEEVRRQAENAAFHDSRFEPVTPEEAEELDIEVSVLSDPRSLEYSCAEELLTKLRPGRDGVILRDPDGAQATFLPQVWQQLPEPELFLTKLCHKAGLDGKTWRKRPLEIQTYDVHCFTEAPGRERS
ncbi:MAG: AMMECR1 domain-containing protein [Deltaproteobacteria bacterium]|nr:MAG: AMMECR1 domain-containing protein [Deltaproteobacteria bacterium]